MSERVLSLTYRAAGPADGPAVADLLRTSLGKQDDPHYEAFLAWKHQQNAFGASPAWVALDEDRVVGYRTFLRWRFVDDAGRVLRAVRAVDTATDPAYRGQGIFRRLTIEAVADLTRSGDAFVFNTPNDQSRPGYLSMGWSIVRRVPVAVLPRGVEGVRRMRSARVPAQLWSQDTGAGLPAAERFGTPTSPGPCWRTRHGRDYAPTARRSISRGEPPSVRFATASCSPKRTRLPVA